MEKPIEKESSKRSWPWKKKANDKISAAPEFGSSPNSSRLFDDQQRWDYHHQEVSIHSAQPSPPKDATKNSNDRSRAAVDEARIQWQQSEEKVKTLNEKLANALADITTKENLVKQHVKVAEEAVTGWEKAEAEAVSLKTQLDVALQQKLATEDRVAHLDGALKECMKQLRHVREEQEQRIHDTLVKKTREYDKLRLDMETKLAEASHMLAQSRAELLESRAEGSALSHALQERSRSIAEISEAKIRAETDIKILQVRLETVEKENSNLKYEVHVLNKELEIRNEEREYERKAVDVASKQHLESVKKIAKLEEECNRLRLLVRKKLPGPAALQRMRMEVDGMAKDPNEKRRRSLGRSVSNLEHSGGAEMQENAHENGRNSREAEMLAERVVAIDKEMKMLKEALAQRNGELQTARLMCSKTATRLSVVEEELDRAQGRTKPKGDKTANALAVVGGNGTLETNWAAALVAELDLFKKGKSASQTNSNNGDSRRESQNFELMDDFAEMERLAMTEAVSHSENATATMSQEISSSLTPGPTQKHIQELEEALQAKDRDLETKTFELSKANAMCREIQSKLAIAEEQLTALQARNSANELSLINLQDQLDRLNEDREKSSDNLRVPLQGLSGYTMKDILGKGEKISQLRTGSQASSSEGEVVEEHASVSDAESKASTAHLELAVALRKIIRIVEAFAQATGSDFVPSSSGRANSGQSASTDSSLEEISAGMQWKNLSLDSTMRSLALISNKFLRGKTGVVDFMTELGTALDAILALKPFSLNGPASTSDLASRDIGVSKKADQDGASSNGEVINTKDAAQEGCERERERLANVDTELERLKAEKAEVESSLEQANEQVEQLKFKLHQGERFVTDRRMQRQSAESPDSDDMKEDELIEEELMVLSSSNPALRAASGELNLLHEKVAALEMELHGERQRHHTVVTKLEELQQVQRGVAHSDMSGISHGEWASHSTSEDEDCKSRKITISDAMKQERDEREIAAAALAECQRTILALGKQLKGMGTVVSQARETTEASPISSADSATSIQKMTENMEYLRWQTEAVDSVGPSSTDITNVHNYTPSGLRERGSGWACPSPCRSPSPGGRRERAPGWASPGPRPSHNSPIAGARRQNGNGRHRGENGHSFAGDFTDGPSSVSASPGLNEFSGRGSVSVPGSPSRSATVPLSLRTRTSSTNGGCANGEGHSDEASGEKPRSSSTFSRFYSRSRSGSSGSSG